MNIYLTCYGVDTRHKESINSYDEIIDVLKIVIAASSL